MENVNQTEDNESGPSLQLQNSDANVSEPGLAENVDDDVDDHHTTAYDFNALSLTNEMLTCALEDSHSEEFLSTLKLATAAASETITPTEENSVLVLQNEVSSLKLLLAQAKSENHKAAQAGLDLLEEKENLLKNFDSLQLQFEHLKQELNFTQQSLDQKLFAERQLREKTREDEDEIELEKYELESVLSQNVNQLKKDLKTSRNMVYQLQQENERLALREKELNDICRSSEKERIDLKNSLKQAREREKRVNLDLCSLEDENVNLQQQVSNLKMRQIENDKLTGERDRLDEKCLELTKECEELFQMKETFKSYYEKTIEALNSEKEVKKSYVQELEKVKQSYLNSQYIPYQEKLANGDYMSEDESFQNELECYWSSHGNQSQPSTPSKSSAACTSLKDELKQLDPSIGDKINLQRFGRHDEDPTQEFDDSSSGFLSTPRNSRPPSESHLSPVASSSLPHSINSPSLDGTNNHNENKDVEMSGAKHGLDTSLSSEENMLILKKRNSELQQEIDQLKSRLKLSLVGTTRDDEAATVDKKTTTTTHNEELKGGEVFESVENALKQECEGLKIQLLQTKEKLRECEKKFASVEDNHRALVSCNYATLNEIVAFSKEVVNLQQTIDDKLTSQAAVNNHSNSDNTDDQSSQADDNNTTPAFKESNTKKSLNERLSEATCVLESIALPHLRGESYPVEVDTDFPMKLVSLVQEQVRQLKRSVDHVLPLCSDKNNSNLNDNLNSECSDTQTSMVTQNEKLRAELAKKRDQITTLRAVLKANKHTGEVAMNTLKNRYEQEKQLVMDSMSKYRNELKKLKSDAATFAYIRSMLVSRCDSLTNQFEEKRKECKALQDQMATLEKLLKMVISQKLALNEMLEEKEIQQQGSSSTEVGTGANSSKAASPGLQSQRMQPNSNSPYSSRSPQPFNSNAANMGTGRQGIPQRYAKNPRASDATYLKKAFVHNNTNSKFS